MEQINPLVYAIHMVKWVAASLRENQNKKLTKQLNLELDSHLREVYIALRLMQSDKQITSQKQKKRKGKNA